MAPIENIDRNAFGHWLSGFTDGEGCFKLGYQRDRAAPYAVFAIHLRADDIDILRRIQAFLGVGSLYEEIHSKNSLNDQCRLQIRSVRDLHRIVVPHFEAFPLQAKKARDFAIWREAIALMYAVITRGRKIRRGLKGAFHTYSKTELDLFHSYYELLREQRKYTCRTTLTSPPRRNHDNQQLLF